MGIEARLDTPLAEAVRKVGSQSAFARLVGRSQPSIHQLLSQGGLLWPESVLVVEAETGISRHRLRPDVYGPEATAVDLAQVKSRPSDMEPAR